jgi:hypothetical protein
MHIDKELNIYFDKSSTAISFKSYVDLLVILKIANDVRSTINLPMNSVIELRDFLNYCYPKT